MNTPQHPTDEQLSAALDGQDPAAADHAASCPACAARLEALRAVQALVATPPVVDDEVTRTHAIRAALDVAVTAPAASIRAVPEPRRLWAARRANLLAAAAVLAVVAIGLSLVLGRSGTSHKSAESARAGSATANGSAAAGGRQAGNLGSFANPADLRSRVAAELGESPSRPATDAAGSAAAPASTTTLTPPGRQSAAIPSESLPCQTVVARDYNARLGSPVLVATLDYLGTAAVLFAYALPGASGGLNHQVFVLADNDCRLLTEMLL